MSYLDEVNEKRKNQSANTQTALMIKAMQAGQKPSIILTDSTDLGEHISQLGDKIIDVLEAVKDDKSTKDQIDRINDMTGEFRSLVASVQIEQESQADRIVAALNDLKRTVTSQKPVIVPAPAVSFSERDVDLNPLVDAISRLEKLMTPKKQKKSLELSSFRAHDLADSPDNLQYIGFQDTSGNWYIMQHDPENNRDRYYFGTGDYELAWDDKFSHDYKTLSEAIRAL